MFPLTGPDPAAVEVGMRIALATERYREKLERALVAGTKAIADRRE